MSIIIEMPKLSDTMTEGTLVKWIKKVGDTVTAGDILAEVETDKATMEMEAFDDGTLSEVFVEEGQVVEVGKKLALLLVPGEKAGEPGGKPAAKPEKADVKPQKSAETEKSPFSEEPAAEKQAEEGERVKASPLAKKIAAEAG